MKQFVLQVDNIPQHLKNDKVFTLFKEYNAVKVQRILNSMMVVLDFKSKQDLQDAYISLQDVTLGDNPLLVQVVHELDTTTSNSQHPFPAAGIAPKLGLNYAMSKSLEYKYPLANVDIVSNISNAMMAVPAFYNQVLHLMNKMNLPVPFYKDGIPGVFSNAFKVQEVSKTTEEEGEQDGEESIEPIIVPVHVPKQKRSIVHAMQHRKRPKAGIFKQDEENVQHRPGIISDKEVNDRRMDKESLNSHKLMKEYQKGTPSKALYVKNIAKTLQESDLEYIFGYPFESQAQQQSELNIVYFTKGKLKGQAFVEYPNIELAEKAIEIAHGLLFEDKPLIVTFRKNS